MGNKINVYKNKLEKKYEINIPKRDLDVELKLTVLVSECLYILSLSCVAYVMEFDSSITWTRMNEWHSFA